MKTDIREKDDQYELAVDLPGFKKDEINLDVKDGYLTISAQKGLDKDEENKKGRILRQERYAGVCSRSFYVGEYVYDPAVGDPDNGIAPGTAFEDLPDNWVCPLCGVGKDQFSVES